MPDLEIKFVTNRNKQTNRIIKRETFFNFMSNIVNTLFHLINTKLVLTLTHLSLNISVTNIITENKTFILQ